MGPPHLCAGVRGRAADWSVMTNHEGANQNTQWSRDERFQGSGSSRVRCEVSGQAVVAQARPRMQEPTGKTVFLAIVSGTLQVGASRAGL